MIKLIVATIAIILTYSCGEEDLVVNVEAVNISEHTLNLQVGQEYVLVATVYPENATNKKISWYSDNTNIATVQNGKVKALQPGTAYIEAVSDDGGHTAACEVNIVEGNPEPEPDPEPNPDGDVQNVSNLSYQLNTPADQFIITWTAVENAIGYKCWYKLKGGEETTELEATDNGDGTWSVATNAAMYPGTYTIYVQPIPSEGHALYSPEPASIEIVIPDFDVVGIYYRYFASEVEAGVEYEDSVYDLGFKYMNIRYKKPESMAVVANGWYMYTTTPVKNMHHLEMWYGLYYDNEKQSIRIYSSTQPGVKQHKLTPDGKIMNGYWKVYYTVPEGHDYIYIEGDTKYDYLSRTGSLIHCWPTK